MRNTPLGPLARTMRFSKSSTRERRPRAFTVKVSAWPGGAGSAPTLPAANCVFCPRITVATSVGVMPSRAILSGCSQTRMEEIEPKSATSPTPGILFRSSSMLVFA